MQRTGPVTWRIRMESCLPVDRGVDIDIYGVLQAIIDFMDAEIDLSAISGKPKLMSLVVTPSICKAARTLLGWSQEDLCQKSGVSLRSLTRFESGSDLASAKVRDKLYDAFRQAGLQFIAANTDDGELDGVGIRWRPKLPHNGIKVL